MYSVVLTERDAGCVLLCQTCRCVHRAAHTASAGFSHPCCCTPPLHPPPPQVACGGMNSVVLTEGGEVWTWGEPWGEFALELQRAPRKVG